MQESETVASQARWYVVHCKALKERLAAAALEELLGLQVYLPEVRRRFRKETQTAPLFPRYLFVHADLNQVRLSAINALPNVVRLVAFGGVPQPMPARVLAAIEDRLLQLEEQGGLPAHNYQPGDTVQLRSGPMRGLEAIFAGSTHPDERVRVLVEFLGELREIEIDIGMLEGTADRAPKSERRTRGKGRRINYRDAVA